MLSPVHAVNSVIEVSACNVSPLSPWFLSLSLSLSRAREKIMDIRFYTWAASPIIRYCILSISVIGRVFTRRYGIAVS